MQITIEFAPKSIRRGKGSVPKWMTYAIKRKQRISDEDQTKNQMNIAIIVYTLGFLCKCGITTSIFIVQRQTKSLDTNKPGHLFFCEAHGWPMNLCTKWNAAGCFYAVNWFVSYKSLHDKILNDFSYTHTHYETHLHVYYVPICLFVVLTQKQLS